MKDNITFIMHRDWLENIKDLPIDQQDKIIADMVRYGVDLDLKHAHDPVVNSVVNMVKKSIDFSKEKYQQKVEMSKVAGRKKTIDDEQVYSLAREVKPQAKLRKFLEFLNQQLIIAQVGKIGKMKIFISKKL